MSKIDIQSFRIDRDHMLRARLNITTLDCEKCVVKFRAGIKTLDVLSTSVGSIVNNEVIVFGTPDYLEIYMAYPEKTETGECFVSFLNGDHMVHSESLEFPVKNKSSVVPLKNEIAVIKTSGMNFNDRLKSFKDRLATRTFSKWSVHLELSDDIIVRVKTRSKSKTWATFGELSEQVLVSDFIFALDPEIPKTVIPREMVWSKFDLYDSDQLCCSELVQADFHKINNIYYKTRISNIILLDDVPRENPEG